MVLLCEGLVIMAKTKKVCLFIVEGVSDESALSLPLKNFIERNRELRFFQTDGDLTTRDHISPNTILNEVGDVVERFLRQQHIRISDLARVVQIVDMDGCFIPDSLIHELIPEDGSVNVVYGPSEIRARHISEIQNRNHQKQGNILKICYRKTIKGRVPYSVYYFSCNMDHVTGGNANMPYEEKVNQADAFAAKYMNDPAGFTAFFESVFPSVERDYKESWEFQKEGTHSLERFSNLYLFLQSHLPG